MTELTKNIPALEMRAAFQPSSANDETRTVDVVWSTGERVLRSSFWDGDFLEELSMEPRHIRMGRLQSGRAPFLLNHNGRSTDAVVGVIESARIEGGKGIATVRFAKDDPEADKAWNKVRQGILGNVSVGYRVHKFEKAEGADSKTPILRATDWEPFEVSLVPMGADSTAQVRSGAELNLCTFINRGEPPQQERSKMSEQNEQRAADVAPSVDENKVREEGARLERERVSGINAAVRAAGLDLAVAEKLVAEGTALEAARALVLEKLAERNAQGPSEVAQVRATVTDDNRDKFVRGVSAWLIERSGASSLIERAKQKGAKGFEKVDLDGAEFRGMSIVDVARACLERAGVSTRGMYNRNEIIKRALELRAGLHSTSDFDVLFENVMHKSMLAAYAVQSDTWRRFCGTDTVSDFREANRFRNGTFGTLDVVAEGGEYTNKAIPDGAKISIATETRGNIISISRQALVNDDMGALTDLAVRFGRSAGLSIEAAVYALLQENSGLGPTLDDSNTFFHASRGNIGTGAALSVAALIADKVKMRQQQDPSSNEYLDLLPRILLVPAGLEADANLINVNQTDPTASATQGKQNMAKGMFGDIVSSPRLTNATRRWLFTESKEAFKVVFLEGSGEGPTLESEEGFRTDGLSWKARIDFKVNPYDPKTALTNAGA
jgi:HK97 family phage prohead protease